MARREVPKQGVNEAAEYLPKYHGHSMRAYDYAWTKVARDERMTSLATHFISEESASTA
jgi:hypothetical protein